MKEWATAFAVVGVFASFAYCTVQESQGRKEERLFEAKLCDEQGGKWTQGWGSTYCDFETGFAP